MSSPFAVAVHCFAVHRQRSAQRRRGSRRKSRPRPAPAYASAMTGLLCLDLGTTSAKAALLDLSGRTLAAASAEYPTRHTAGGGAEQDPADWVRAARTAIARSLPPAAGVAALCLTGQMQDLVLEGELDADSAPSVPPPAAGSDPTPAVDSAGSPAAGSAADPARDPAVHPAVLYTDLRAGAETAQLRTALARDGVDWDALAGNLQDASSCAAMFHRLARHRPESVARARGLTFGPAGHLAHVLGAGLHCDPTTAAATGLLDARTRDWAPAVARAAGIDPALLPRLTRAAGEVVGRTGPSASARLGLPAGVPIVLAPGGAGAATLRITGFRPGQDHASLGTSGRIASVRSAPAEAEVDGASHPRALGGGPAPPRPRRRRHAAHLRDPRRRGGRRLGAGGLPRRRRRRGGRPAARRARGRARARADGPAGPALARRGTLPRAGRGAPRGGARHRRRHLPRRPLRRDPRRGGPRPLPRARPRRRFPGAAGRGPGAARRRRGSGLRPVAPDPRRRHRPPGAAGRRQRRDPARSGDRRC